MERLRKMFNDWRGRTPNERPDPRDFPQPELQIVPVEQEIVRKNEKVTPEMRQEIIDRIEEDDKKETPKPPTYH